MRKDPPTTQDIADTVPRYLHDATKAVLAVREQELLDLKGPCRTAGCRLHYAHSGPCDIVPTADNA